MHSRPAIIQDAPQITALLHQLGYRDNQEAVARRLEVIGRRHDSIVLVAEDESQRLLGCIHVMVSNRLAEGMYGEIASLVIAEGHRQRGIGRQLVENAAQWLHERGMSRIRVRCNVIRKRAHRFYESLGFEKTKSQKVYDRNLT